MGVFMATVGSENKTTGSLLTMPEEEACYSLHGVSAGMCPGAALQWGDLGGLPNPLGGVQRVSAVPRSCSRIFKRVLGFLSQYLCPIVELQACMCFADSPMY